MSSESGPEATDGERRVLVEELLESVAMYPDHLEVTVSGAPRLDVTLEEIGLTGGGSFVVSEARVEPHAHRSCFGACPLDSLRADDTKRPAAQSI